jgi:2-succinyl-6-hydroxy-2,4-cyclohexadiene-1-carboxylate synthase
VSRAVQEPELYVDVAGEGPTVLLAHGFGGSSRNFRPQLRALRLRYRAVAWDARGHARSAAPEDPDAYRLEALASDVGRVLDRLGAERGVVGGLSLGAATSLAFALEHPNRVLALVLASYPAAGGQQRALDFADCIEAQGLEAAGARFVWGPESGLDERGAAWVRQGFLEHPPQALAHLLRGSIARLPALESLVPRLVSLDLPVLLVAGERDAGSLAASQALQGALARARLEIVQGAGHVVNLERPGAFNTLLQRFLDALGPDD